MSIKKIFFSFALLAIHLQLVAQDELQYTKARFREYFSQAHLMTLENFNDTALKTFLLLHKWELENANINYRVGELFLKSASRKNEALPFLQAAKEKVSKNYTPDDPSEKKCPYYVFYLLGQSYHLANRFDDAIAAYQQFSSFSNKADVATRNDVKRRIEMCNTAKQLINTPIQCTIMNMGDSINSKYPDYSPVITADESEIYFTSRRYNPITGGNDNRDLYDNYYEDIWVATKKPDSTWSQAKSISTHINSWYNEAVIGISADGQQLLIYKDDKGGSIYYSRLDGDQWSYPNMIGTDPGDVTDINSPAWETSASLSPDGNTLFFASDRLGGYGGRDIYTCVKLPTGKWSKATNAGASINTPYDEDAPFLHPDGMTLFFSSNGHKTMGGFDIFFTVKNDSSWAEPTNIGYPINTADDDVFYVMSADGRRAYFSSTRQGGKGEKDIYLATFPNRTPAPVALVKGRVSFAVKDSLHPFVTITATDIETGEIVQEVHPNTKSLKYILPLNAGKSGKTYTVRYEADGFRPYSTTIKANQDIGYKEIEKHHRFKTLGTITLQGRVTTRTGAPLAETKISIKETINKKTITTLHPQSNGNYEYELPGKGGESYTLVYEAGNYFTVTESIEVPSPVSEYEYNKSVVMELSTLNGTISVSGMIKDPTGFTIPTARISVVDNSTGLFIGRYTPKPETGIYYFSLITGNNYNISYEAEGYLFQSENINISKANAYSNLTKDITLIKMVKGAKIVLKNIFFDSGKSSLRKESNIELDKILSLLKLNPTLRIEIGGHTDNKGKPNLNLTLSQQRANAVIQYLISNGVDAKRLAAKGYGDAKPLAPNVVNKKPNATNMQTNRRVEFIVLEK